MSAPVPGTGRSPHCRPRSRGVSGGSRIVPHRFADEGDRGRPFRRLVRRRERNLWRKEATDD